MSDADEMRMVAKRLQAGKVGPKATVAGLVALHDQILAAARQTSTAVVRAEREASGAEPSPEKLILVIAGLLEIWARDDNTPMTSVGARPVEGRQFRPAPRRTDIAKALREAFSRGVV